MGRPVRFALLAVVVCGAAALGPQYWFTYSRHTGSGPAGPSVPGAPFARVWSQRPVLLLGIGDSITSGVGADWGYGYFERLAQSPPGETPDMKGACLSRVFPKLTKRNLAVAGSTSLEHAARQIPNIPKQAPGTLGWVVMTTGGNDLIHNYGRGPIREGALYGATWEQAQPWIASFERRLDGMLSAVSSRFPGGCRIFLGTIYDPTDGRGDLQHAARGLPPWPDCLRILDAYNDVLNRCAMKRSNVYVVDLHRLFLGHGIHCRDFWSKYYQPRDASYWFFTNLEDPDQRGHDAIRRAFLLEMVRASKSL